MDIDIPIMVWITHTLWYGYRLECRSKMLKESGDSCDVAENSYLISFGACPIHTFFKPRWKGCDSDLRSRCGLCHLQPFHYEESGVTRQFSLDVVKSLRSDLRLVLHQMINITCRYRKPHGFPAKNDPTLMVGLNIWVDLWEVTLNIYRFMCATWWFSFRHGQP